MTEGIQEVVNEPTIAIDNETEYKTLTSTSFTEITYEVEKYLQQGWALSEQQYPFHSFILYEVHMYKNDSTILRAKARMKAAQDGRDVFTTEKRRESMAKARAAVGKGKNKEGSDEG
jgi:hypothetical protein